MLPIADPGRGLAAIFAASLALSAFCQRHVARAPAGPRRSAAVALLLAAHFASPLAFETGTGACVCAMLSATLFGWWGTMKVLACVLSAAGPLSHSAHASPATFYAAYFLPVTHAPGACGDEAEGTPSARALCARFVSKLGLMLCVLAALDPRDDGTPAHAALRAGTVCGDLLWALTVLLAASGMMDFSGALAVLALGVPVREAFRSPLAATSLCDFWGRRWNLTAVRLLRACCYEPLRASGVPRAVATGATFAVSGLAHEAIMAYGSAERYGPHVSGRWLAFFVVQGALCAAEAALGLAHERVHARGQPSGAGGGAVGVLGALELSARRLACVGIVFASARPLFLAPAYAVGWPHLLSSSMLRVPRLVLRAAGVNVPLAAVG